MELKKIFKQNLYIAITLNLLQKHHVLSGILESNEQWNIAVYKINKDRKAYLNYELSILQLLNAPHLDKIRYIVLYQVGKRLAFSVFQSSMYILEKPCRKRTKIESKKKKSATKYLIVCKTIKSKCSIVL